MSSLIMVVILLMNYFFVLFYSLMITNMLMVLIFLELLSWIFSNLLKQEGFKYLLVQSVFFMTALLSVLVFEPFFFIFFMFKLGLPPFYPWIVMLSMKFKKFNFVFYFTLHKLLPFFLLKSLAYNFNLIMFILIFSSFISIIVSNLMAVFVISSFVHSVWMIFAILVKTSLFLNYWGFYVSAFILFFNSAKFSNINLIVKFQSPISGVLWLVIGGLPPFLLFWLKIFVVSGALGQIFVNLIMFILIFSSFISIIMYYRVFSSCLCPNFFLLNTSLVIYLPLALAFF